MLALVLRDAGVVTVLMLTAIGLGAGVTGADYLLSRRAGATAHLGSSLWTMPQKEPRC